jgi:hypothetical protein
LPVDDFGRTLTTCYDAEATDDNRHDQLLSRTYDSTSLSTTPQHPWPRSSCTALNDGSKTATRLPCTFRRTTQQQPDYTTSSTLPTITRPTSDGDTSSEDASPYIGNLPWPTTTRTDSLENRTPPNYGCERQWTRSGKPSSTFGIAETENYMEKTRPTKNNER